MAYETAPVRHLRGTRDDRGKCADDGHKARDDNRFAAVLFVEAASPFSSGLAGR
ncbi:MAG: hypothetical protein WKF84_01000 [Pyrinomonadaceae bacterium]